MTQETLNKVPRAIFVTGTDTDCGKTFVSCALIVALIKRGYRVVGMKPAASGSEWKNGVLVNSDVESLKYFANVDLPDRTINPYIFAPAISPHFAAKLANEPIELDNIIAAFQRCLGAADVVIVEGAGGWRVPLGDQLDMSMLVKALNIPVLLVSGLKLGSINHTLLSAESIQNEDLDFIGWVANLIDPTYDNVEATIDHISAHVNAPLLAQLAWYGSNQQPSEGVSQAARLIDINQLERPVHKLGSNQR